MKAKYSCLSRLWPTQEYASQCFVIGAALLLMCQHVSALIAVDSAVSKRFTTATSVLVGKIATIDLEKQLIEATATETLKGQASTGNIRLRVMPEMQDVLKKAAVGQPVVIMTKGRMVVHLADQWLLATKAEGAKSAAMENRSSRFYRASRLPRHHYRPCARGAGTQGREIYFARWVRRQALDGGHR